MVGVPSLTAAPVGHGGGVYVGDPVLVVLPAVPLPLQDLLDGTVVLPPAQATGQTVL